MPARRLASLARQSHYTPARYAPPAAAQTTGPTTRNLPAAVVRRMQNARRAPVRQTTPLVQTPVGNPRQPNGVRVVSGGGVVGSPQVAVTGFRSRVWPSWYNWYNWGGYPYGYGYGGYPYAYAYGGAPWSNMAPYLNVSPWGYGPSSYNNYPGIMWPGWGGGPGYGYNWAGPNYGWA